jgi:hypothetical protein
MVAPNMHQLQKAIPGFTNVPVNVRAAGVCFYAGVNELPQNGSQLRRYLGSLQLGWKRMDAFSLFKGEASPSF